MVGTGRNASKRKFNNTFRMTYMLTDSKPHTAEGENHQHEHHNVRIYFFHAIKTIVKDKKFTGDN
jgi:hypothetical protein